MVIEYLMRPFKFEHKPWKMFFLGVLYSSIAIFLSLWIFKRYSSLVMVFLTVIASLPIMFRALKMEEKADMQINEEGRLMKEHAHVITFLLYLFMGYLVAMAIWFIVLPADTVQTLFSSQLETIGIINSNIQGSFISSTSVFMQILLNNIKVLMFCIFFAFFYGAGALFILTWNASVISAAIGSLFKNKIADIAAANGAVNLFNYFHVFSFSILRYSIHGIPEIAAYFVGAMAGGIISVAMINHDIESDRFKNIMIDALDLTLLALFILVVAALMEVTITPLLFSA
ncbi:MAG TPA: stage II sporulation protein M [Candidatus Nanoarchaeia archaeon]|nr:stage II sporulation protein M [Candidatus Nanoarchaeia archaeon]